MESFSDTYGKYIKMALSELKKGNYCKAETSIKQAMLDNPHSPEVHNLYGILEEFFSNCDLACKHYRAAYALDPTYKPAIRNLARITDFYNFPNFQNIDYGDQPDTAPKNTCVVVYDRNYVGHLRKGKRSV